MADCSDSNNSDIEDVLEESGDFREHLRLLKAKWKAALKKNKKLLLKCPNYERCQSKCGSVGGMQYHYERCTGNAPRFKCDQCGRTYESRTGLNYHMASSHLNEHSEDNKSDSSARPQRSAALNTMSAIHISNNPLPVKQSPTRTPPKVSPTKVTSPKTPPLSLMEVSDTPSPRLVMMIPPSEEEEEVVVTKKSSPGSKATPTKNEGGTENKLDKKATKYVTIPSIEYPDEYKSFLPVWRQEMKENKIIKCPNYKECDFKCTTVNGMKYHFVRCGKANPPEFNCELCGKKFQCRTGLVWHLKKTHKLIDIQPSKGGGFKGTLPARLMMGPSSHHDSSTHSRKKLKLSDEGRENRSPGGYKTRRSFSRRKRYTPHKTPEEILQNVAMIGVLPSPTLGPRSVKEVLIPLSEYHVFENIPTDKVHDPSTIIQLGEEALTWQGISSDSDSEGDYTTSEMVYDEDVYGGYRSSNSLSDSDDDYMFGASKKKPKPKTNGSTLSVRPAAPRRGRPPKNRDIKDEIYEPISLETLNNNVPPLLSGVDHPTLPQIPALIKTPDAVSDEPYTRSLHGVSKSLTGHVQPPSALIMPVKSEPKLPGPPPLLKNNSNSEDSPHILLPPSTSQLTSMTTPITPLTTPTAPRRPGRPPKSKTIGGTKNKKTCTSHSHYRPTVGSKGQSSSSHTSKGMKMTQYEFLSSSGSTKVSTSQPTVVSYDSTPSLHNIVTPVQIIQGVPTAPVPVGNYQSVQPASMVLMQGTHSLGLDHTSQPNPSYITQDGQTYQIIQSPQLTMSDDNSQKVSVIMQPGTATYTTKSTSGGMHYITQLDGTPPVAKPTNISTLRTKFDEARKQEHAKLSVATVSNSVSPEITAQSSSSSQVNSEEKMTRNLDMYLAREHKQISESVPANSLQEGKGRKHQSSFVRRISHDKEKPKTTNPVSVRKESNISTLTTLFQPDNIPIANLVTDKPETSSAVANVSVNSNYSNSNDHSPSNAGDGAANATPSEGQAISSDKTTKRGRGRPRKGSIKKGSGGSAINVEVVLEGEGSTNQATASKEPSFKLGKRGRGRSAKITHSKTEGADKMKTEDSGEDTLDSVPPGKKPKTKPARASSKPESACKSARGRKMFKCDKCDIVYNSKKSLANHIATVHDTQLEPGCPLSECVPIWRKAIKIAKSVVCSKCGDYRAVSVEALKYHWNRCNKEAESFTERCPECDKEYKSLAGLRYHMRAAHTAPPPEPSRSSSPEQVLDPSQPLPPRRAAANASKKMAAFTASSEAEPTTIVPSPSPSPGPSTAQPQSLGLLPISADIKAAFIRKEIVDCPYEGCDKTFKTLGGLKYHLGKHLDTKINQFKCPVCKTILKGVKRFENHIRSKHADEDINLTNITDHEYAPTESADESDNDIRDDWEAEKDVIEESPKSSQKSSSKSSRRSSPTIAKWMHNVPSLYAEYQEKVNEVWCRLYEGGKVLQGEQWTVQPQYWKKLSRSNLTDYLPNCQHSVPFVFGSEEAHTLPLFTAHTVECESVRGAVFFVGGPVWSMDWLPVLGETSDHFLALAAYQRLDETFQIKTAFTRPGLLQFWKVGSLSNEEGHTSDVQFSLGLIHNYGIIRDMKWCPSVRWSGEGERLGVLALACSDGTIRILVIPHPDVLSQQLSSSTPLFAVTEREAAVLVPSGPHTSNWSEFGQCLCLDWLPSKKYARIAAGFSNGVVSVWDLENSLPDLHSQDTVTVIHPLTQLTAHKAPCRTLVWCPHDHHYLFTGGYDKCGCVWDLRQPQSPLERQDKGLGMLVNSHWPILWNEIVFNSDTTASACTSFPVSCLSLHHGSRPIKNILHCSAPVTSVTYCPWSDRVAAGSYGGEVSVVTLPTYIHLSNTISEKQPKNGFKQEVVWLNHCEPVTTSSLPSELTSVHHRLVLTPHPSGDLIQENTQLLPNDTLLQATTQVMWNPNKCSHEWMLIGSNTGLVQLVHIQAPKQKPSRFFSNSCYQSTIC